MRIIILVHAVELFDAVAMIVEDEVGLLEELGYRVFVCATGTYDKAPFKVYSPDEIEPYPEDILHFHYANYTPLVEKYLSWPGKKLLSFHNITPSRADDPPRLKREVQKARDLLPSIVNESRTCLTLSEYSAAELRDLGSRDVRVIGTMIDFDALSNEEPDADLAFELDAMTCEKWLTVGRIAPHKGHLEAIDALLEYNSRGHDACLFLVGDTDNRPEFTRALSREIIARDASDRVFLTGKISYSQLVTYYGKSDRFVILSEHEGFCLPTVEAMNFELPIVAYAGGALPTTVGAGGTILHDRSPQSVADALERIAVDSEYAAAMIGEQKKIAFKYSRSEHKRILASVVEDMSR